MRQIESWRPTRFVPGKQGYRASTNVEYLAVTSRFVAGVAIRSCEPLLREYAQGHVLDLGCGLVPYFGIYSEKAARVTCVDWPGSLHASPHVDVHADLNSALPFRDSIFDTVLLTDVLEHIIHPRALLCEVERTLRAGGRLVVSVPFFYGLHEEPHDYHRYTCHALRRLCDAAGLSVVHLEPYGGVPEIMMDLMAKNVVFSRLLARAASRCFAWIGRRGLVRRISRKTAHVFPLGYCLVGEKAPLAAGVAPQKVPAGR